MANGFSVDVLSVRLTSEQLEALRIAAIKSKMRLGEFVRTVVVPAWEEGRQPGLHEERLGILLLEERRKVMRLEDQLGAQRITAEFGHPLRFKGLRSVPTYEEPIEAPLYAEAVFDGEAMADAEAEAEGLLLREG